MNLQLRTGRKVGRTLYLQLGEEPSDDDLLVGLVDTPALAKLIVEAVNRAGGVAAWFDRSEGDPRGETGDR